MAADFNNDGNLDLLLRDYDHPVYSIFFGKGDGTFLPERTGLLPALGFGIAAGDFNGDGNLDLAVQGRDAVWYLAGDGKGGFAPGVRLGVGKNIGLTGVAAGDFNGDGKLDVLATSIDQALTVVRLGNGDGTFQPPLVSFCQCGGFFAIADLNGDHIPDLVTSETQNNGDVYVALGKGDGTFAAPTGYPVNFAATGVAVSDLSHDGIPDLVVSYDGAGVAVLTGNGDGTFQAPVGYATRGSWDIAAGDLNGDGKQDLVVTGSPYQFVEWLTVLLNTTP